MILRELKKCKRYSDSKAKKMLKITPNTIKKYSNQLNNIKKYTDIKWKKCGETQNEKISSKEIKEFIDNNNGNVTIKDIHHYLDLKNEI